MEYILYLGFVAIAIGGIALLLNKLGQSGGEGYTAEEATLHFRSVYGEEKCLDIREAETAVLIALEGARLAIVRPMGKFPLIRIITANEVRALTVSAEGMQIRTVDYSDPSVKLRTAEPETLKSWIMSQLKIPAA